ncbi:hypothetical protein FEM48_Zijuj03G0159700 [Ziziphus jujuba var. spinosa]|uniref:Uncharacterized protein n=1 Tax=Ziziphus jujuba var. spinosa TaxID=714518 RepID=A0A978VR91_ZIZJJ|nr:hypothetical protein FEM48_Zijuj03G0159700 [Ziziphus jujuba var. spinosa]
MKKRLKIGQKRKDGLGVELELDEESKAVSEGLMAVTNLMEVAELKVNEYKESRKKEKSKLKNSVVSLTEENRNINSLLKIALVEMESVEKSLSRLNMNIDQKRQIYFEHCSVICNCSYQASTMVRIMKNLNLKITQLRRSLEESRYFIIKI